MGDEIPDLYCDNVAISVNQHGLTLTLQRTIPVLEEGQSQVQNEVVGRVRMSHELARTMAELLTRMNVAAATQQATDTTKKH